MNEKGYRVSMDVYSSEHYDQFKRYFEYMDKYSIGDAIIFTPEIAYLLIEPGVPAVNLETSFPETLPGAKYRSAYIDGFNEGVTKFQKHWNLAPDTVYGPNSDHYFNDLRRAYEGNMNGDTASDIVDGRNEPGWLHELNTIPLMVNENSIKKQGYYAGLVSKYRELELKHDRLRVKPEPVIPEQKREPKPFRGTLEEACVNEKALKYLEYFFTTEKGCCDPGTFTFIKRGKMTLTWLAETIKGLKTQGYTFKLTNEEVYSIMVSSFKADCTIDIVKRTHPKPERIGKFLGNS